MPWDIQSETVTVTNQSTTKNGVTWEAQVERFPLVQVAYTNGALTNSRTLTLTAQWSVDGVDWTTLGTVLNAAGTGSGTAHVDTSIFSSKPTGSKYFRLVGTASGAISAGQSMISNLKYAWWIQDAEQSAGARAD